MSISSLHLYQPSVSRAAKARTEKPGFPSLRVTARDIVRLAQRYLRDHGHNPGPVDGLWGNRTQAAYERMQGVNTSANRTTIIRLAQMFLWSQGHDPGPHDGVWGGRTQEAYDQWQEMQRGGLTNPWPQDTEEALTAFYGEAGRVPLVHCHCPYPMRLAWRLDVTLERFSCHPKVKASLQRVLDTIFDHYHRDPEEIAAVRMDRFGGCYNNRPRQGNWRRPSLHARGAAIDLDPEHNAFRWGRDRATMPPAVIDIFEAEGWLSAGRSWGYDFMHFQATRE